MNPVVIASLVGGFAGIAGALIAGLFQSRKVSADVELTAAETAAIVLKELREEREDLRKQVAHLEQRHDRDQQANRQAIRELRAAENRCQTRLRRAVEVMRANGLTVPHDLDDDEDPN